MSKQIKTFVIIISVAIILFVVAGGLTVSASSNDGAYRQLGVYAEVLQRIRSEYVEEPNIPQVTTGALHGLLESLDANSSYMSPAEYKQYKQEMSHEAKANIGATISKRYGYGAVVSVLPGSPAEKAGLKAGDVIEAIESRTTRDMSAAEVELALSGEKGSKVTISIIRPRNPKPEKIEIIRDNVALPGTLEKVIEGNIGYLDPGTLTKGKADELTAKIKAAEAAGAKKLILDLRNVSDGDPQEGIAVANLFLDHGTITYLQGQKFPRKDFTADSQKTVTKLPLVVLINRGTANAAEIVAAAILENGRGDVVGDKSFGLGSVQKLIETPDGSALILSVAKYYTPSGKAIQDQAVTPNIVVADADQGFVSEDDDEAPAPEPQTNANPQSQQDEQLQRAITVLKNKSS